MCKIIEFKPRQRNGYLNLKELFEICNNVKSCDFYLGLVEYLYNGDHITEKEMYGLRRIGRTKRLSLVDPKSIKAEEPGTYLYTPEMGEQSRMDAKWKQGFATVEIITGSGRR